MPEHYFTSNPQTEHDEQAVRFMYRGNELIFITDAGTFSRDGLDEGSSLLISALPSGIEGAVLDLGCGWGAMGVAVAKTNPACRVLMCDVNERAVALCQRNIAQNGLSNARALVSDGVPASEKQFTLILLNPPIRAGKATVYRLFRECHAALSPNGSLYIVIRKQQGAESAQRELQTMFAEVERVERSAGFWVLRCGSNSTDNG